MTRRRSPVHFLVCACLIGATGLPAFGGAWDAEIAAFAIADRESRASPGGVLFVGSSSIRLWKTLPVDFPTWEPVNRGFGGAHIADCVENFDVLMASSSPRAVVFYAGSNDLAAGKSAVQVARDFSAFAARLHADFPETRLVFLSIVTAPARWELRDRISEANALIAKFCAEDSRRAFVDVNSPLLNADRRPREDCFTDDRLHLAANGYAAWRSALLEQLQLVSPTRTSTSAGE